MLVKCSVSHTDLPNMVDEAVEKDGKHLKHKKEKSCRKGVRKCKKKSFDAPQDVAENKETDMKPILVPPTASSNSFPTFPSGHSYYPLPISLPMLCLKMKYFFACLDYQDRPCDELVESDEEDEDGDDKMVDENWREPIAHWSASEGDTDLPTLDISQVDMIKFHRLLAVFDKYMLTASFSLIKIQVDVPFHRNYHRSVNFKSVNVYQSAEPKKIECRTTVFSFGKRILETTETQDPMPTSTWIPHFGLRYPSFGPPFTYHFDFCHQFFKTFFENIRKMDTAQEMTSAVENLSIMQCFVDARQESNVLLCQCFEFGVGSGATEGSAESSTDSSV